MKQVTLMLNRLFEGYRLSEIANECNTSVTLVGEQISKAIREHRVTRSKVLATLATIPKVGESWHDQLAMWVPAWQKKPRKISAEFIHTALKDANQDSSLPTCDLDLEEVKLYLLCFEKAFEEGELYEALCEIERTLHARIKQVLVNEHGINESGWWRKGVPVGVRQYCVELREKDSVFVGNPPYSYTTLGQLADILKTKDNQSLFKSRLPLGSNSKAPNMNVIFRELERLTKIRNRVMHPIGAAPTEEEFFFVKRMQAKFDVAQWR